jgi:hypothetical protein
MSSQYEKYQDREGNQGGDERDGGSDGETQNDFFHGGLSKCECSAVV